MRRRMEKKTNYARRLRLLKSGKIRVVIRRTLNSINVQFIEYKENGDITLNQGVSKSLRKYGWEYHGGNTPSAYLIGYLTGLNAVKNGVKDAVFDIGIQSSVKGSVIYAALKGVKDAGVGVDIGEDILPSADRIAGKHIKTKGISEKFEEVRKKIADEFGVEVKEDEEEWEDA